MKPVKEMSEIEFLTLVKVSRKVAQSMMMATRCSPIPDRPMHPNAKMSGGDKPVWDADMSMWLNMEELSQSNYFDSTIDNQVKGEIDGME